MLQSLAKPQKQPPTKRTAFFSDGDIAHPCDYAGALDLPTEQREYRQTGTVTSLRPFLKSGHKNLLISYCLMHRPKGGGDMILPVSAINKIVSPELGLNRTTVVRQLERIAAEKDLPNKERNPHIIVEEYGEKKRGQTNQRYFRISFKQKKCRKHVRRYFESLKEAHGNKRVPSSILQLIATYEHEADLLEKNKDIPRLTGAQLAHRTGFKLRTIRKGQSHLLAEKTLEAESISERYVRNKYYHKNGRRVGIKATIEDTRKRHVYRVNSMESVGFIVQKYTPSRDYHLPGKIYDFTKGYLNSSQASETKNRSLPKPSPKISPYQSAWERYSQIFTPKEGESLRQSLGAAKKYGVHVPTPERLMEALERSKDVPYLKLAHRVGFCEAQKAELLARGGSLNDTSVHWKKDFVGKHARLGFLWLLKHAEAILAGQYDRRELSEKAKGRVLGGDGGGSAPNTTLRRTEIATEWFKGYLRGSTPQKDLRGLLMRLWGECGWSAYEALLTPCEIVKDDRGRWTFVAPNGHHADLMESKLNLEWWRVVRPKSDRKAHSPMREAYELWLKETAQNVQKEQKDEEPERVEQVVTVKGEEKMGFVPGNDDEGVIPYWTDKERSATKARKDHRSRRTPSEDMEASDREIEEEILRERHERQEQLLGYLSACTNIHRSERSLRTHTIAHYGISAYQCWFDRCKISISGDVARYVAPSDFIGYEIERRYEVLLESYTAKGEEITVRKKKEKM